MKDSKENIMGERKGIYMALENRDVACATATSKIPGQKGNKLNPNNACTPAPSHTITQQYHTMQCRT